MVVKSGNCLASFLQQLPGPALRPAVRHNAATRPWCVQVFHSTRYFWVPIYCIQNWTDHMQDGSGWRKVG